MGAHDDVAKIVGRAAARRGTAERIAATHADNPQALSDACILFALSGADDRALAMARRAATLAPGNADFAYNLAVALEHAGDAEAAIAAHRRAVALAPDNARYHYALVRIEKQTPAVNRIPKLESLFAQADPAAQLHAGHALAKTYEDFGDLPQSFAWLAKAKATRRAQHAYDRQAAAARARAAMSVGDGRPGCANPEPIFIIGLPRTGTTLIDRILSSHPDVTSAGEPSNFPQLVKAMAGTPLRLSLAPQALAAAMRVDPEALGKAYIASTRPITGAAPRFIDKAPINYLVAGAIHRALPNARIISVHRAPLDACLSLYRQLFETDLPYYDYAYDLADTAYAYARFREVAAHLRATLPADRYCEVLYEDVVAAQDSETRRLLEFCGLTWDPRCLDFHENAAAIATPSGLQVRQPLYASAVGRAQRYGALMDPARDVLVREGILTGADAS